MARVQLRWEWSCAWLSLLLPVVSLDAAEPVGKAVPTIIVTAEKVAREERRTPISMTVVDGERMQLRDIDTTDDLSRNAANTHFSSALLYVRGIGSNAGGFEPSVGVFIDGVYFGRSSAAVSPLLDIAQVELIRGPQGTLLGKNTIGGALNFSTTVPADAFSGSLGVLGGSVDERDFDFASTVPLGRDWRLRVAAIDERRDGLLFNTTLSEDAQASELRGARGRLDWDPSGAWSSWLSFESGYVRDDGPDFQLSTASPETLSFFRLFDPATETRLEDRQNASDAQDQGVDKRSALAILNVQYDFDDASVTSLSSFGNSDGDGYYDADRNPAPLVDVRILENYEQASQELRIAGGTGDLDYIAGLYVLHSRLHLRGTFIALPDGGLGVAEGALGAPPILSQLAPGDVARDENPIDFRQSASTESVFAQASWAFAPDWLLTGGLRWTQERKRVRAVSSFMRSGALFVALIDQEAYDERRRRREDDLSPRAVLQYQWNDATMLYVSAARGYKGGGFSEVSSRAEDLEYDPEQSSTLELGFKSVLLDRRLGLNLALFETDYEDLQVSVFDGTRFYIENAAVARIRGAELEARARLSRGWSATASAGALHARYRSYPDSPDGDLSGAPLPRAPDLSAAFGLEYESPVFGPSVSLRAAVDATYRDQTQLTPLPDPIDMQEAHWRLDALLQLASASGQWSLSVIGRNLTDQTIRRFSSSLALFSDAHAAVIEPGRSGVVALRYTW